MEVRKKSYRSIFILILVFLHIGSGNKTNSADERIAAFTAETQTRLLEMWNIKSNETYDKYREKKILHLLGKNSGIYQSKSKAKRNRVERTVLLSVISSSDGKGAGLYKQMLRNWLCYTAHYDYMPVVYYLSQSNPTNQSDFMKPEGDANAYFQELKGMNENVVFVDYPTHLFWSLLTKKQKWKKNDRNDVDFEGNHPSFAHHGALVMLVPILEVLELGYSVIYMDIDIALVRDPVPFIALGISDINVSPEVRSCVYYTRSEDTRTVHRQTKTEPNTGLMLIRDTALGIELMRRFLAVLVDENRANDQPFLTDNLGFERTTNCHYNYSKTLNQNIMKEGLQSLVGNSSSSEGSKGASIGTLCFLQDVLFQNGNLAFTCAERDQTKTEYMLITNRLARLGSAEGTTTTRKGPGQYTNHSYLLSSALHAPAARLLVHLRDVQSKQDKAITANRTALLVRRKRRDHLVLDSVNDLDFAAPLTVHANYCGTKHRCFSDRGLWLLDAYPASSAAATAGGNMEEQMKFRCKAYNKEDTKFGKPKWIIDLDAAESAFSSYLNTFKVGEVVQYGRNPEVYIVDYPDEFTTRRTSNESARPLVRNKGLRLIQNVITLDKLGLPPIRSIADAFADQMILGSNILDLTETNISYRIDQKQNITFFDVFDSYKKYEHSVRAASGLRQKPLDDPETLLDNVYTNNSEYQSYWSNAASWTVGTESRQVREVSVKESIQRSRGVYRDWKKAAFHGLENTVLVTVLSYDDILDLRATGSQDAAPLSEGVVHGSYSNMLRSYLRSMRDNGLKPLLYFTPSQTELDLDSSTARTNILQVLSNITASNTVESEVEIAYSYPNLLLFSFFSSLTTWAYDLLDTSRASSYKGKVPNVYSFGILMMLVPILEVVSLGHSVIFIDVTVKFHRDPIPYLSTYRAAESSSDRKITTSSNSSSGSGSHSRGLGVYDVAVCKESTKRFLDCNIKSFDYSSADGGSASTGVAGVVDPTGRMAVKDIPSSRSQFRPNFSIMKFAGTEGSMSFLNSWIQDVVAIGDRLGRESYETLTSKAEESFECNYDVAKTYSSSSSASDIPLKGQGQGPIPFDSWHDQKVDTNISAEGPVGKRMLSTYCYLNAVLFTTQEVSTQCYKTKVAPEPSVKPYTGTSAGTEEANRTYVAVLTNSNPSCAAYFEPDGKRKYFSS